MLERKEKRDQQAGAGAASLAEYGDDDLDLDPTFPIISIKVENEELFRFDDCEYGDLQIKEEVVSDGDVQTENEDEDDVEVEVDIQVDDDEEEVDVENYDEKLAEETSKLVARINQERNLYIKKRLSSLLDKQNSVLPAPKPKSPYKCNSCLEIFRTESELNDHECVHGNALFQCLECNQTFDRFFSLRIHQSYHATTKPFTCNICYKSFTRNSGLKDHKLSHTGEKPFQCDQCKKYYRSKLSLMSHIRIHTHSKNYECRVCKKTFFQPSGLTQHLRRHRDEKEYKCHICSKYFAYDSSLKRHIKTHFGVERHRCDQCEKVFRQYSSLLFHKRTKHLGLKPYKCEDCNKTFPRSWSLRLHMNRHRSLQMQPPVRVVDRKKRKVK